MESKNVNQISIDILENLEEKDSNFLICWYLGHSYYRIYKRNGCRQSRTLHRNLCIGICKK